MKFKRFLAIDPGAEGAATIRDRIPDRILAVVPFQDDYTILSTCRLALEGIEPHECAAVIEKVHGSPIQGPGNAFRFGENFGAWRLACKAFGIRVHLVTPQAWQRKVAPHVTGQGPTRKRGLKEAALAMFDVPISDSKLPPKTRITLTNADSLLLSEYARLISGIPSLWEAA